MISEYQMGDIFDRHLKKSKFIRNKNFTSIVREREFKTGIPDFLCSSSEQNLNLYNFVKNTKRDLRNCSRILAQLKNKAPRKISYISQQTNLNKSFIKNTLGEMLDYNLVKKANDCFTFDKFKISDIDLWSFELKLNDWKGAIHQASRYSIFSNRSIVVLPINKKGIVEKNLSVFQRYGIGVLLFDYENDEAQFKIYPKNFSNLLKSEFIYAFMLLNNEIYEKA